MANREQLAEINRARAGDSDAQISLAKRYLFGEPGLPRSARTALLWLERAAEQENFDACVLIGRHITVETAKYSATLDSLLLWYKKAFLLGIDDAGLTFAELILMQSEPRLDFQLDAKIILEKLSSKNIAKAQWLLVTASRLDKLCLKPRSQVSIPSGDGVSFPASTSETIKKKLGKWITNAAIGGITEARLELAESAWADKDYQAFLTWALPEAELIQQQNSLKEDDAYTSQKVIRQLADFEVELLYRCAVCLCMVSTEELDKAVCYLELAAMEGNAQAQLSLGLWLAKMDSQKVVLPPLPKRADFQRATEWLTCAGCQGLSAAWYAISRIYLKAEFVGRNVVKAEHFLMRAAELEHCEAQLELGTRAWRMRHKNIDGDLNAAFWLQKAVRQGCKNAEEIVEKIAPRAQASAWAMEMLPFLTPLVKKANPFLAVRIELAALMGLSKLEAIWLDIHAADQGHCLVVDVVKHARNTKRRLISLFRNEERQAIDRMKTLFHGIECNKEGPEGDYRRRMYCLNKLSRSAKVS